jgi:DNA polymerase-3 subunit alpha
VDDWTAMERLDHEFDAVGFYLSAHPLDAYEHRLKRLGVVPYGEVARGGRAGTCRLAGIVAARQERTSSKGSRFAYVGLTDSSGSFEVVVFSDLLVQSRELLETSGRVLITAESRTEGDGLRLIAQRIESLDRAIEGMETGLLVRVTDPACLQTLKSEIAGWKRGRGRVSLVIDIESEREVELKLPERYSVPADGLPALGALAGVSEISEI